MFINGYFVLFFDLTPVLAASEGHASPSECGTKRIEVTFKEALNKAITCLLYLEYDNSVASIFIVLSQQTFNHGHSSDIVYLKGRQIVSGCFSIRYATAFYHCA